MVFPLEVMFSDLEATLDVQQWSEWVLETAQGNLKQDGYVAPVLLFLCPNPKDPGQTVQGILPLMSFFIGDTREETHRRKDLMAVIVPRLLKTYNVYACALVTEAWMTPQRDESYNDDVLREIEAAGGVSKMEGRIEVLMVLLETQTSSIHRAWRIERDEKESPSVGEEMTIPAKEMGGRFGTLLHARTTEDPN